MKKSIIKSTSIIFIMTIISKAIGFVKSMVQASYYGATIETDAYNMAWGIVGDILYLLTTAIAVAFVPLYIQTKSKSKKEAGIFATKTITLFSLMSICFIALLEISAPFITKVFAPNYSGETFALTVRCFRILTLGFVFSILISLYQNMLNAERIYGYSAASSIINSLVLIGFIILLADKIGIDALVYSVLVSYFVQAAILYLKGKEYGRISLSTGLKDERIKLLILQAVPVLISQATVEINQAVDRALLTAVAVGAVTSVSYAVVLYQFVSSLISLPLSTVMFTELSEAGVNNNLVYIRNELSKIYKLVIVICIPIMIVTWLSADEIVGIIYGHGNFHSGSLSQVSIALRAYILCLIPVTIKAVLSRAYYSLNDTKRPMIIGTLEVIANITLSIILVRFWGIFGVVIATAIASYLFVVVLIIVFNIKYGNTTSKLITQYWKVVIAAMFSFAFVYEMDKVIHMTSIWSFIFKGIACFICYLLALLLLRDKSCISVFDFLNKRIRRGKRD